MSAATQPEHYKWIAFAHLIASGEAPISEATLERIAQRKQFEGPSRLQLAEKQLRHTVAIMLVALNGSSRRSVIEFLGLVYRHEKGQTVREI